MEPRKIDSSVVWKDGKIEAVQSPVTVRLSGNFVLVGDLIGSEAWRKVSQASGISE